MSDAIRQRLLHCARVAPVPYTPEELTAALDEADEIESGNELHYRIGARLLARARPHGSITIYDPRAPKELAPQRLCTFDPGGEIAEEVCWTERRTLREAKLRLPAGGWVRILPLAARNPLWGESDELALAAERSADRWETLTVMEALQYERLTHIPAAAEPAKLKRGAGSVLLNFLAELLIDEGIETVGYRGPYPSDQLLESLHECFRFASGDDAAALRARFTQNAVEASFAGKPVEPDIAFAPEPFELCLLGKDAAVFLREGAEKCFWKGRTYERAGRHPLQRPGARRLWQPEEGGSWFLGLWLLGAPLEVHGRIDLHEQFIEDRQDLPPPEEQAVPAHAAWGDALRLLILSQAAGPLRPALTDVLLKTAVVWAPLHDDIARFEFPRVVLRRGIGTAFAERIQGMTRADAAKLALALVAELAQALTRPLLGAAQGYLAGKGAAERALLLSKEAQAEETQWMSENAGTLTALCAAVAEGSAFES